MAAHQYSKTSALTWTQTHPWGAIHPYVVVTDSNQNARLVAPDYTVDGQVTIRFSQPTAGVLTLIGPDDTSGGGNPVLPAPEASKASGPWGNAVLVMVSKPGDPDAYGDVTTDGVAMWVGQAAGYLKRETRHVIEDGRSVMVKRDVLWLTDTAGAPVVESPGARWQGSQVTVDDLRLSTPVRRVFTVAGMEHRAAGTAVDNVRLELAEETVPS